jgi:glycerol uptake facilitator-like aquaporin
MLFHFIGSASPTASANSVALMGLVYYTAKTSGGHLNPAVTTVFTLLGHNSPLEMVVYWAAQVTGAILGALLLVLLSPGLAIGQSFDSSDLAMASAAGCFVPDARLSNAHVFGWEAVGSFCFFVPIFSVVWYTQNKSGYGNTGPIMVGLSLFAAALAAGPRTGAALNPARAVASAVVVRCPSDSSLPYYVLGELMAALLVPLAIMPWYGIATYPWWSSESARKTPDPEGGTDRVTATMGQHGLQRVDTMCHEHDNDGNEYAYYCARPSLARQRPTVQ